MTPRLQAVEKYAGPEIAVTPTVIRSGGVVGYAGYDHTGAAFDVYRSGGVSGNSVALTPTVYNAPSTPGTMVYQGNALVGMTR